MRHSASMSWLILNHGENPAMETIGLTHWGQVTHICVSLSYASISSDNGLLPCQCQAIDLFDLRLNKRLSKQSWGWWFDMRSCSLWRHCNDQGHCCSWRMTLLVPDFLSCYLGSPGHCLTHWSRENIITWNLGNKLLWNLNQIWYIFIQENAFKNVVW